MHFDGCALDYEQQLNRGLKISGQGPEWFARLRVELVRDELRRANADVERIIEFGCGTGNNIPFLHQMCENAQLVGVDISEQSLAVARRRHADTNTRFATPQAIDESASVDLVFVNGVFHHIPPAEHGQWIAWLARVLKPGGLLAFFDNNPFSLPARLVMKLIPFDRDAVMVNPYRFTRLLSRSGFHRARPQFHFIFPRPLSFLRSLEQSVSSWPLGAQYSLFAERKA